MTLSGSDLDKIFGTDQVISSNWALNGKLSLSGGGRKLTIDPVNGLVLTDALGLELFSLGMDGAVDGVFLDTLAIKANQLAGQARSQNGVLLETFDDKLVGWIFLKSTAVPTYPPHGQTGGLVVSTDTPLKCMTELKIPYDSGKTYRIKVKVKRTDNAGTAGDISVGVQGWGANPITKVSRTGTDDLDDPQWVGCDSETPSDGVWTEYVGYFSGTSAAPSQGASTTPQSPNPLHEDVRYFSPVFYLNETAGDDTYELDGISIEIVPSDLESGLSAIEVASALPSTGNYEGRIVYLTSDDKLYRHTGASWTTAQDGADITAGTIEADKMDVDNLSAISANIGTITAGTITGVLFRTAASGARVELNSTDGLKGVNGSDQIEVQIDVDGKIYCESIQGLSFPLMSINFESGQCQVQNYAASGYHLDLACASGYGMVRGYGPTTAHLELRSTGSSSYVKMMPNAGTVLQAGTSVVDIDVDVDIDGDLTITGTVDGVDVAQLKSDFDALEFECTPDFISGSSWPTVGSLTDGNLTVVYNSSAAPYWRLYYRSGSTGVGWNCDFTI